MDKRDNKQKNRILRSSHAQRAVFGVGLAAFIAVLVVHRFSQPIFHTFAALGDAGNFKVTMTREGDGAAVSGTITVVCDGSPITVNDNDGSDDEEKSQYKPEFLGAGNNPV